MQYIYDQAIFFAFFLSLALIIMYSVSPQFRGRTSPFLTLLLGAIFVGLLGKVFYIAGLFNKSYNLIIVSEIAGMMFGASIFLLVRGLIENRGLQKKDLIHFLPTVIYSLLVTTYFIIPGDEVRENRASSGQLIKVVYACFSLGILVNVLYGYAAWKLYTRFSTDLEEESSYIPKGQFIKRFLIVYACIMLVWICVYGLSFVEVDMLSNLSRKAVWLSLTFSVLFLTYYGFLFPDIYKINPIETKSKYTQSKLTSADLDELKLKLDRYMAEKKPYLNKKLLKSQLAKMLELNDPDLARLLNEKIGMNFFEYVNYFRIKEFIRLFNHGDSQAYTFFGIAQEAGFNSKTTFNKSFKKIMGLSPSQYFEK